MCATFAFVDELADLAATDCTAPDFTTPDLTTPDLTTLAPAVVAVAPDDLPAMGRAFASDVFAGIPFNAFAPAAHLAFERLTEFAGLGVEAFTANLLPTGDLDAADLDAADLDAADLDAADFDATDFNAGDFDAGDLPLEPLFEDLARRLEELGDLATDRPLLSHLRSKCTTTRIARPQGTRVLGGLICHTSPAKCSRAGVSRSPTLKLRRYSKIPSIRQVFA